MKQDFSCLSSSPFLSEAIKERIQIRRIPQQMLWFAPWKLLVDSLPPSIIPFPASVTQLRSATALSTTLHISIEGQQLTLARGRSLS